MFKITKTLLSAGLVLGSAAVVSATPAAAQDVELSANVALFSEYRFRGVALDDDPALQGGFDASYEGFYVGTWGSTIDTLAPAGDLELDVYGGWGTEFADGFTFDIGALAYLYPGAAGADYYEFYTSIGGSFEMVDWTIGGNWSPSQDNTLDEDILYVYGDLGVSIPDTPVYLGGHLGYEDGGAFTDWDGDGDGKKLDWSLTAGVTYDMWDISVSYVDTDEDTNISDAAVVFGVGASF